MRPHENNTISELLQMPLNEDVFERILGILEQEQRKKMGPQLGQSGVTESPVSIRKTARKTAMIGIRNAAFSLLAAGLSVNFIHAQARL